MDNQQQRNVLEGIGGDPLEGSGFETETPVLAQELPFEPPVQEQEADDQ